LAFAFGREDTGRPDEGLPVPWALCITPADEIDNIDDGGHVPCHSLAMERPLSTGAGMLVAWDGAGFGACWAQPTDDGGSPVFFQWVGLDGSASASPVQLGPESGHCESLVWSGDQWLLGRSVTHDGARVATIIPLARDGLPLDLPLWEVTTGVGVDVPFVVAAEQGLVAVAWLAHGRLALELRRRGRSTSRSIDAIPSRGQFALALSDGTLALAWGAPREEGYEVNLLLNTGGEDAEYFEAITFGAGELLALNVVGVDAGALLALTVGQADPGPVQEEIIVPVAFTAEGVAVAQGLVVHRGSRGESPTGQAVPAMASDGTEAMLAFTGHGPGGRRALLQQVGCQR
jgi:hypothetical protein